MPRYFNVTPPSVHQMILTLERRGLIARVPGRARSITVLVVRDQLPALDCALPRRASGGWYRNLEATKRA